MPDDIPMTDFAFGRIASFDPRSRAFPIRALIAPQTTPRSYTWSVPIALDQGQEPACTGFAVAHEAAARPVQVKGVTADVATSVYRRAQQLDEWPGESYGGSSVLAAVKAGQERGWYGEYRWAFGIWDLLLAVGYKGPAILGINWYSGMMTPDATGLILPTGHIVGGHAILATAVNVRNRTVRLRNSWSAAWGIGGDCYIPWGPLQWLLEQQGEACIPVRRSL